VELGIEDIGKPDMGTPDFGDAVELDEGEEPVFE